MTDEQRRKALEKEFPEWEIWPARGDGTWEAIRMSCAGGSGFVSIRCSRLEDLEKILDVVTGVV